MGEDKGDRKRGRERGRERRGGEGEREIRGGGGGGDRPQGEQPTWQGREPARPMH